MTALSMTTLRDYQMAAVNAAINYVRYKPESHGIIVIPTGGGKSHVIAAIAERCASMGKKVIVLAHREELLRQNGSKFKNQEQVGYYSASLGERELDKPVTIAGIQSIVTQSNLTPDLIIIDEVHHAGEPSDNQYWQFIQACGNPQVIGLTATNFRTDTGKTQWAGEIYKVSVRELIERKFITPITNKAVDIDLSPIDIKLGEYVASQLTDLYTTPELLSKSVESILLYSQGRNSCLIFVTSIKHGEILQQALADNAVQAIMVTGSTPKEERRQIATDFRSGAIKYVINCMVWTEGFDAPNVDMIVALFSTLSPVKWAQVLGRGCRIAPNKENCLLIDMGGNLKQHGGMGAEITINKGKAKDKKPCGRICPICETFVEGLLIEQCPDCGHTFPESEERKVTHNLEPDMASATISEKSMKEYDVIDVDYRTHKSRKSGNESIRIIYYCAHEYGSISEYINPHHENDWVKNKAYEFFKLRGKEFASLIETYSLEDLVWHCSSLKKPIKIIVDENGKFPEIKKHIFFSPETKKPIIESMAQLLDDEIPW
jgi:DNA repair protein RadD